MFLIKKLLFTTLLIFIFALSAYGEDGSHYFCTGMQMEIDRCASAWLIKRFVDPSAKFKFFPEGELIDFGTPFDTPDAELRRTHRLSTFEVILENYHLSEKRLKKLGLIIREIEINYWGKKKVRLAVEVDEAVRKIINESTNNKQCLEESFVYFDRLVNGL